MARYQIFANPEGSGFLLDVQSDFVGHLKSRVVVPLYREDTVPQPVKRLHPVFTIGDARYTLATPLLGAVSVSHLGAPIGNLAQHRDEIVSALDMLFQGF